MHGGQRGAHRRRGGAGGHGRAPLYPAQRPGAGAGLRPGGETHRPPDGRPGGEGDGVRPGVRRPGLGGGLRPRDHVAGEAGLGTGGLRPHCEHHPRPGAGPPAPGVGEPRGLSLGPGLRPRRGGPGGGQGAGPAGPSGPGPARPHRPGDRRGGHPGRGVPYPLGIGGMR